MALAELRRRIAVQQQRLRQWGAGIWANRAIPGRRSREFGDDPHPHRVMVASGQQRGPRWCAERRRVEAVVLQAVLGQPLGRWRRTGARLRTVGPESAGRRVKSDHSLSAPSPRYASALELMAWGLGTVAPS